LFVYIYRRYLINALLLYIEFGVADTSWARTWWESHYFQLPWQRVKIEHSYTSLQSSRPHWLNRSA